MSILKSCGFTLIEMLVVFSIIGMLTGVGFASFVSYSKKQTLDQAVSNIKTGIDQAKFNAVSRVKPAVSPCTDSTPLDRYRIRVCTATIGSCSDTTHLYETAAGCVVAGASQWTSTLVSKPRPSNITATIDAGECGADNYMQFSVLSGIDGPCRITVSDGSATKTICVDGGGNTSVLDGSVSCGLAFIPLTPTPTFSLIPTSSPTPTPTPTPIPPTSTPTPIPPTSTPTPIPPTSTPTPTPTPACTSGYKDFDKDGYGAQFSAFGCYTASASYNVVANSSDCYDLKNLAKPGQTSYFTTTRGTSGQGNDSGGNTWNSFDYNCSATITTNFTGSDTALPTINYCSSNTVVYQLVSGVCTGGYSCGPEFSDCCEFSNTCTVLPYCASYTTGQITCGASIYKFTSGPSFASPGNMRNNSACTGNNIAASGYYTANQTAQTVSCR